MMGYSHAVSGVAVGCGLAALCPAPWPVEALAVAVFGGAALLPDIDHVNSTVARSLGPLTNTISRAVDWLSVELYHATRTPLDPASRTNGHRLITHTPVGSAVLATLFGVAFWWGPVSCAVAVGLVCALLAHGTRAVAKPLLRKLLGFRGAVAPTVAVVCGVSAYGVSIWYPGWWWLYAVAVLGGCLIHREGDWCTNSGVPYRRWPMLVDGCRWAKSTAPATFKTGQHFEHFAVRPLLYAGCLLGFLAAVGLLDDAVVLGWKLAVGGF